MNPILNLPKYEEDYNKVYDAIRSEMGYYGARDGGEFIAQSIGLVYNGSGKHPIADSVLRYLKDRLR